MSLPDMEATGEFEEQSSQNRKKARKHFKQKEDDAAVLIDDLAKFKEGGFEVVQELHFVPQPMTSFGNFRGKQPSF